MKRRDCSKPIDSFNGVAAVFKPVSSSEITTTVPTGAGTGLVTVTTSSGTLNACRLLFTDNCR